jgi:NAD(P)-dependent dehydrogenase (short-subunit alcohol dehydrogenase family)
MSNNPFSLSSKTILVTGASSGIGRAVAIECSKEGASIIATGRNKERLEQTLGELEKLYSHLVLQADLTNSEEIAHIVAEMPVLDGAVFCAGVNDKTLIKMIDQDKIDKMFQTNVFSQMLLIKELIKKKKLNAGASLVMISSIASTYSTISNSLYAASKGAVESYMRVLALELAPRKIRVNAIRPGMVETPILESYALAEGLEEFKKQFPLGRFGRPEEIAYGIIYLLSDASQWTTGSCLTIDGGITLR